MKIAPYLCMLLVLPVLYGQEEVEPIAWKNLELDLKALKKLGSSDYTYSLLRDEQDPVVLGKLTLSTEVAMDAVMLKDVWDVEFGGEKIKLEMKQACRLDNYLTPVRIDSVGEGEEAGTFTVEIDKGMATMTQEGEEAVEMEIPVGTITTSALFRLLTLLPEIPGEAFAYSHSLEAEEMNLKKDFQVTVMKPEIINHRGADIKCFKFRQDGQGMNPCDYWVDGEGRLLRILMDDRKLIERVADE